MKHRKCTVDKNAIGFGKRQKNRSERPVESFRGNISFWLIHPNSSVHNAPDKADSFI
jgi:hypothetical protein